MFAYQNAKHRQKTKIKSHFYFTIGIFLQEKVYICTQISVSWKEIEKFAKHNLGSQQPQYLFVGIINHRCLQ